MSHIYTLCFFLYGTNCKLLAKFKAFQMFRLSLVIAFINYKSFSSKI